MAFQLKASNSLEQLAKSLYQDIHEYKGDVFRPYYLVTQTDGMNNWLGTQLAEWQGIAAGIQYLKPNDLIFRIYLLLGGSATATMSADNLCWLIYSLMGSPEFIEQFPKVAQYYSLNPAVEANEIDLDAARVKRLGLAKKVADLFDQYQIYRSDMIIEWNKGNAQKADLENWQFYLWNKARSSQAHKSKKAFADKNEIAAFIEQALQDPRSIQFLLAKMPVVYIFGISLLTEFHLHIFDLLADKMQIYFYLLNPAPSDYWYDDLSEKRLIFLRKQGQVDQEQQALGHPLLQSMGKIIKDTFGMLFKKDEILNSYEILPEIYPAEDSLLHKLQLSIFENRTPDKSEPIFSLADIKDGSLTVHSCYSPLREVESLYNFLVDLIDHRKQRLSPRDIVVMVSDIDHYAAYIRAVFDHAPFRFPYRIADERFTEADSITSALESILLLESTSFTAETVLRLLDSSYIRKHLGINRIDLIRDVLEAASIRFGIAGSFEDDSVYVSWRYGLERIMYGICMAGEDEVGAGPEGFFPLDLVEGSDSEQVIRFVAFAEDLMEMLVQRKTARTLAGWSSFIKELLEKFILKEEQQGDEEFEYLATLLADYNSSEEFLEDRLSFAVFMESFGDRLGQSSTNSNFASGGVTFCSLIPMRSIPFKVVALLGLDYDKFPRREQSLGFNLMELKKRPGDRNVKANDKHLFLETLLSARDYLYISYIGRNIKDNSDIPASSLVDELIDYIAGQCAPLEGAASANGQAVAEVGKMITVKHALHHFSTVQPEGTPQYLHLVTEKAQNNEIKDQAPLEDKGVIELEIPEFIRFIQQPIKGFLNKIAGIYYEDSDDVLKEEEIFELNTLQRYQYRNLLMELKGEQEFEQLRDKGVKTGKLPLKNYSRLAMMELLEEVEPIRALLEAEVDGLTAHDERVSYSHAALRISGKLTLYGDKLIVSSWSKNEIKKVLEGFVGYLLLVVCDIPVEFKVLSFKHNKVFKALSMDKARAKETLDQLILVYLEGQKHILPIELGLKLGNKEPTFNIWYNKIQKKSAKGDYTDPYIAKADELGVFSPVALDEYLHLSAVLEAPLKELFPDFEMLP